MDTRTWTYGDKLKQFREARGMTQRELAEAVGREVKAVGAWESGKQTPPADKLRLAAEVLGCPPDEIGYSAPRGWELVPADWIREAHAEVMSKLDEILKRQAKAR